MCSKCPPPAQTMRSCVSVSCGAFVVQYGPPSYSHLCWLSSCIGWTTVTQRWSVSPFIWPSGCSRWWILFCCSACVFCDEIRPHHAAPHTAALVKDAGADRVQAGCSGIQMPTPDSSAVSLWGIPLVICCRAASQRHRLSSDAPVFQPSAIEVFWSLLPDCGTLCPITSRRRRQCLF